MFEIDTGVKQEALNFAALLNALDITGHRLEPLFDEFGRKHDVDTPLDEADLIHAYADFFKVDETRLLREYWSAYRAFTALRKTDEIIKRGSMGYPSLLAETDPGGYGEKKFRVELLCKQKRPCRTWPLLLADWIRDEDSKLKIISLSGIRLTDSG